MTILKLARVVLAACVGLSCGGGDSGAGSVPGLDAGGGGGSGGTAGAGGQAPAATALRLISIRAVAVTSTSAVISWYTYVPATSKVEHGLDAKYGTASPEDANLVQAHTVRLTGLTADTTYHYRVSSHTDALSATSEDHTFKTLPSACATGTAHYVDAAAPAGGDGSSPATAWASPEDMTPASLAPGDCVMFQEGSYGDELRIQATGAQGKPLLIYPLGPVVLTAGIRVDAAAHDLVVRGFELTHTDPSTRGEGASIQGSRTELLDLYIHNTDGISIEGEGNVARNNLLHFAEGVAVVVAGTGNLLDDNDVSHSTCFFAGDADATRFFGTGNTLSNNFLHDVLAEDSPGKSPHCDCFQTYAVNDGEIAHDITIEGNYCFNICGQMFMGEGILASDTHANIVFRSNVFEQVGAIAINAGGIREMHFEHNTFVHSGLGALNISDAPGATVTSNLFFEEPYTYACGGCPADYNWIYPYDCHMDAFTEPHGKYGVDPYLLDPTNHDYRPAPGSPLCAAGESGSVVGALPCDASKTCLDLDGDGYGRPQSSGCPKPELDCDDHDKDVNPAQQETCNGKDDDCDGLRDEDCSTPPTPVFQLSFDGSIEDQSPNHLATRWEGGTGTFGEGHQAQAISCTANGPYVVVEDAPKLRGMGMFTLSVWARKDTAEGGGAIALKHVYYKIGVSGDTVDAYVATQDGSIDLDAYHYTAVNDTAWHHYEITYDSRSGKAQLRVDDVVAAEGTGTGRIKDTPCDPRELVVGKDPWGSGFTGQIDELVIYDWVK